MKLAAIYNIWDGEELFSGSVECIKDHVDLIIVVWQDVSNFGERHSPAKTIALTAINNKLLLDAHHYNPVLGSGFGNEATKRNIGLNVARELGCTHFLFMDCDEYYADFSKAKQQYVESGAEGSVCKMFTYFKKPTLRLEKEDNYFVPFIHRLQSYTQAATGDYPFYVDPTRKVHCIGPVVEIQERMHHFSYVRCDIERKCRNSSAKENIAKSQLLNDYFSPSFGVGYVLKDFQNQALIEVPNLFNIETPWLTNENI